MKKLECRYTTGLARLEEAETSVLAMQQELLNLQPILLTKTREVEEKMAVVEKRRQEVAEVWSVSEIYGVNDVYMWCVLSWLSCKVLMVWCIH